MCSPSLDLLVDVHPTYGSVLYTMLMGRIHICYEAAYLPPCVTRQCLSLTAMPACHLWP